MYVEREGRDGRKDGREGEKEERRKGSREGGRGIEEEKEKKKETRGSLAGQQKPHTCSPGQGRKAMVRAR